MRTEFQRIKIDGFRRLASVDLALRPMMVMIGANGVGKTSLLDAVSLLSSSASGNLNRSLSALGGISSVLTRGRAASLLFEVEHTAAAVIEGHDEMALTYELQIKPIGVGYDIEHEKLTRIWPEPHAPAIALEVNSGAIRTPVPSAGWPRDRSESALSQIPHTTVLTDLMQRQLSRSIVYRALPVGPRDPVKLPQQMRPAETPGALGEDLVSFLYDMRESNGNRFDAVVDSLSAAFPSFESLSFPPVAAGTLAMTWKDRKFDKPFYMHELSEGTLRFLWLVAILQSPSPPAITMIDEPEVSLHPELLSFLADLMREASERTQLIVATHSDRLIRFLKPEEVVVMDCDEEGLASAKWADQLDLDKWLAEYSLDEVWRMGELGGRA